MSRRTSRVNDLLREEIATLLQQEVRDPRVSQGLVSITEVDVSPDLRHAVVFVSHLGAESERDGIIEGLNNAAHFLHGLLKPRLNLRRAPELQFRYDQSLERGARLHSLINEVVPRSSAGESDPTPPGDD